MLEAVLKKKQIRKTFVEAGMTDEVTNTVPVFDALIGTCKRWVAVDKDLGIPKAKKHHCRSVFQQLMKVQLEEGQITYPLMKELLRYTLRYVDHCFRVNQLMFQLTISNPNGYLDLNNCRHRFI